MGCGAVINDQYILRVAPDMEWHAACLKCVECQQFLDETCTCFVRDGKTYCKGDYVRLFGAKCDKCGSVFTRTDMVMRARSKIFHLDCFRCRCCGKQLLPGDEFALREDGLFCRFDFDAIKEEARDHEMTDDNHNTDPTCPVQLAGLGRRDTSGRVHKSEGKPTRIRTVLTEKQLHTLGTCYAANPRPDALMKEQLVEMTGLSPRVVRVWFQNKRCKDKKRAQFLKQAALQQEKDTASLPCMHAHAHTNKHTAPAPPVCASPAEASRRSIGRTPVPLRHANGLLPDRVPPPCDPR
ncbi:putative insulin enhancer protein ISL-1-like [Penaeus vannamei]|uniref:Putative insulin enhancer protein ISL-1-like n=1 Tax=Penaeus vannamei TaxID=6689 RepID=A0A3R7MI24_PENVA|nr:putative insulin enhancer protein ISL-1-like [Penaeus vannamei]